MNRDLKDVVIVDDLVHSFAFQLNNGVPILKWCDNKKDCELRFLYRYLMKIKGFDDLREINKKCFHLEELALVPLEKFFKTK